MLDVSQACVAGLRHASLNAAHRIKSGCRTTIACAKIHEKPAANWLHCMCRPILAPSSTDPWSPGSLQEAIGNLSASTRDALTQAASRSSSMCGSKESPDKEDDYGLMDGWHDMCGIASRWASASPSDVQTSVQLIATWPAA